jgi:hypothetical protein
MFKHGPNHQCQAPRIACGPQRFIGRVGVWKPTRSSVVARFPRWMLLTHLASYRWRAEVRTGLVARCRGDIEQHIAPGWMTCADRAPRRRYIEHQL